MGGGFFFAWLGFFVLGGGTKFQFKAILKSRAQQGTGAEAGARVPGEQERAAPGRGKCPSAEKLEEDPRSKGQAGS